MGQAKCTPNFYYMHSSILEWESVHSKILTFLEWNFVHSKFFGVEFQWTPNFLEWTWSALQKFWSGLEVHSKTFGVDFRCTSNFWSELWVHDCLLQGTEKFWSENLSTPNILEWAASHSKKNWVHTFPLQIGVHEVKSWSAFSLTNCNSSVVLWE
jgi:hypothetical protein